MSSNSSLIPIHTILVPQGAEYQAVCRGLRHNPTNQPKVVPIPMGYQPAARYLEILQQQNCQTQKHQGVLLMGLCGSLSSKYAIGDVVLYQDCVYASPAATVQAQLCDPQLTTLLCQQLAGLAPKVRAVTSTRLIWAAAEKSQLSKIYGADVVDMEGFAVLEALSSTGMKLAMLRVVSDDWNQNLPDLTPAISPDGLRQLPLAWRFLRQPLASARLITGALRGLQRLQQVTRALFPA